MHVCEYFRNGKVTVSDTHKDFGSDLFDGSVYSPVEYQLWLAVVVVVKVGKDRAGPGGISSLVPLHRLRLKTTRRLIGQ